jgi:hypothetical protein
MTGVAKPLGEMTKQEKKEFFYRHIISLLERGNRPELKRYGDGNGCCYFLLGRLPYGRLAIYNFGVITVVKRFGLTGVPLWEAGVTYSDSSLSFSEAELVEGVKSLIARYRSTY